MNLNNLDNKEIQYIKSVYKTFEYYADNASTNYKKARKFFGHDRNLNARELDLISLNYLHLYETVLKFKTFQENTGMDSGLYELISIFERIKSMRGALEYFGANLPEIHKLYLKTQEK